MQRAGINMIRIYGMENRFLSQQGAALLKNCSRKYGVYFLPVITDHPDHGDKASIQEHARQVARLFQGEPMLLGYDLVNEPYFWELGKFKAETGKTLWELNPQPPYGWKAYEEAVGLDLKGFTFPGVHGKFAYPSDPQQRQTFDSINHIYGTVIAWHRDAIREVDAEAPLTIGYNTVWGCMAANEPLDFVANHFYEPPENFAAVLRNLTTLDRLQAVWPDRPVCAGEFGYSNGDCVAGKLLDVHTTAVGELLHYLYALAHGCAGMSKWSLNDISRWNDWRQVTWIPREKRAEHLQQARFGLFYDDGTPEGRAKPLVPALRLLRDYIDAGGATGEIKVLPAKSPIGAGYVYRSPNALFVGGSNYHTDALCCDADVSVNVMLWWDDQQLRILTTADAVVSLRPEAFVAGLSAGKARVRGAHGKVVAQEERLVIETLEGDRITIH